MFQENQHFRVLWYKAAVWSVMSPAVLNIFIVTTHLGLSYIAGTQKRHIFNPLLLFAHHTYAKSPKSNSSPQCVRTK